MELCMECVVCSFNYGENRPVTGSCGHSVCCECAPKLEGKNCPTCRKKSAFSQPTANYLATELHEQLTSSATALQGQALSLERRDTVIIDLKTQLETMDQNLRREMEKADELGKLQQENTALKRSNTDLTERLDRCEKTMEHYKKELETILQEHAQLRAKNAKLEDEQQGFIRRETEYERVLKARNDWDMLEDFENVPRPENVVMILPTMKLISDDTKKQLTDLGIVLIQRADLTSRQLLAASKKQYHETMIPIMNNLTKKATEMIIHAQTRH